jgi:hypothetical protein
MKAKATAPNIIFEINEGITILCINFSLKKLKVIILFLKITSLKKHLNQMRNNKEIHIFTLLLCFQKKNHFKTL